MSRSTLLALLTLPLAFAATALAQQPPAATPAPAPAGPVLTEAEQAAAAEGEFKRELLTVEQDVGQLKERTFRSKATLQLLKELVLEGQSIGSSIVLWHVNEMGAGYTIEEIRYFLDGKNVFAKNLIDSNMADRKEMEVYDQPIPAGTHNLQVQLSLRGNGMGVFSYLQSYSFKVQSSYTFDVEDGQQATIRIIADERGGVLKSFTERPNVAYEITSERVKRAE